ncbi:hypothetical protein NDU88_004319 [Pleurodeles waltl]|uniref:Uncharacterized protein n=1 Tax=Pleurodeles waltl TaxID=8319 RepID=A0AAV7QCM2_PLEWA|nr:hypothetical protein NDU88_004319 [Pleurodeles waltl]
MSLGTRARTSLATLWRPNRAASSAEDPLPAAATRCLRDDPDLLNKRTPPPHTPLAPGPKEILYTTGADIVEALASYYEKVYTSMTTKSRDDCADLLRDISLPLLPGADREAFDQDLMIEEILRAILDLQSGKEARPNGLLVELYKCVVDKGTRPILEMVRAAREEGFLPEYHRTSTIVVIPKSGKRAADCGSY